MRKRSLPLRALLHRKLNCRARCHLAVEQATAFRLADAAAEGNDFGFDEEGVAWSDGLAPFHFVGRHEVADFALVLRDAKDEHAGGLGHGFELEDTGHDRVTGEVTLEEVFIEGEVLDRGAGLVGEVDDAVDEKEGVAMGEDLEDVGDVKHCFSLGNDDWGDKGHHLSILFLQERSHFGIRSVPWCDGDNVSEDTFPAEHEVADKVEGFVAGELVAKAARLFGHHIFAPNHDCVFE